MTAFSWLSDVTKVDRCQMRTKSLVPANQTIEPFREATGDDSDSIAG